MHTVLEQTNRLFYRCRACGHTYHAGTIENSCPRQCEGCQAQIFRRVGMDGTIKAPSPPAAESIQSAKAFLASLKG